MNRDPKDRSVGRVLGDLEAEGLAVKEGPETRPLWKVAGGNPPSTRATCHLPDEGFAEALPAKPCRCERPLPAPDDDGDLRCAACGHACEGWELAA